MKPIPTAPMPTGKPKVAHVRYVWVIKEKGGKREPARLEDGYYYLTGNQTAYEKYELWSIGNRIC